MLPMPLFSGPYLDARPRLGCQDLTTLSLVRSRGRSSRIDRALYNANPLCSYFSYGALCAPMASKLGTEFTRLVRRLGFLNWKLSGCL